MQEQHQMTRQEIVESAVLEERRLAMQIEGDRRRDGRQGMTAAVIVALILLLVVGVLVLGRWVVR